MTEYARGLKSFKYLSLGMILLCAGWSGCDRTLPPDDPEPFVRLLKDQTFQSTIFHRAMKYAVLLPKEYEDSTTSFPVVYLLHGMGDNESAWYQGGNISYYADLYASATVPMIYVMPQGFNTYWVNKYNGNYPYMDMFVNELVPYIDSAFRTLKNPQQRAVMGYSMGGYGALILPAKNPGVFKTGVALSMSFRTDQQYIDEPQSGWDSQWGSVFGGIGLSGTARLTDYYKQHNPFYFFHNQGDTSLSGQSYFLDCGDDEENLTEPNDALHSLMSELNIKHEYRVRNGAHNWDYWHRSLPEALRYIGMAVQNIPYPDDLTEVDFGPAVPAGRTFAGQYGAPPVDFSVTVPESYAGGQEKYPMILVLHDRNPGTQMEESARLISSLNKCMTGGKIPATLIVEIPLKDLPLTGSALNGIIGLVRSEYRTVADPAHTVLIGNREGGRTAFDLVSASPGSVNACMLFDANLPPGAVAENSAVDYYLDRVDDDANHKGYHNLVMSLRKQKIDHEYRVRQGTSSHDSFLAGLIESAGYLKNHL